MAVLHKFVWIGLLLLATIGTGFWRANAGNPALSGLLHKLLALAWLIWAAIKIYHTAKFVEPSAALFTILAILGVSIVALFASGSVLTVPKLESNAWVAVHRIASVVAVAAFGITLRLFVLNRQ